MCDGKVHLNPIFKGKCLPTFTTTSLVSLFSRHRVYYGMYTGCTCQIKMRRLSSISLSLFLYLFRFFLICRVIFKNPPSKVFESQKECSKTNGSVVLWSYGNHRVIQNSKSIHRLNCFNVLFIVTENGNDDDGIRLD